MYYAVQVCGLCFCYFFPLCYYSRNHVFSFLPVPDSNTIPLVTQKNNVICLLAPFSQLSSVSCIPIIFSSLFFPFISTQTLWTYNLFEYQKMIFHIKAMLNFSSGSFIWKWVTSFYRLFFYSGKIRNQTKSQKFKLFQDGHKYQNYSFQFKEWNGKFL